VERLVEQSMVQADAGCDILAPSDMMDGRVGAIRAALESSGRHDVMIMAYAAKYASRSTAPIATRSARPSARGDKKTYQMDPGQHRRGAPRSRARPRRGRGHGMVKPGMPYLDICRRLVEAFAAPTFAFQVSGEYAMIRAAALNGWIDEERAILESLGAFKRAGCAGVITYFAPQAARLLG
jgi:porphobilinogen synthase